jgi:hypothetical protein
VRQENRQDDSLPKVALERWIHTTSSARLCVLCSAVLVRFAFLAGDNFGLGPFLIGVVAHESSGLGLV